MTYTVYWNVNDGRCGYPNIQGELDWSDIECRSYQQAIRAHARIKGVQKIIFIAETIGKGSKGKINGRSYRDYLVQYVAKDFTEEKEMYLEGEFVEKMIRVFGSYSGKSKSL